jgi:hypothetical protein
VETDHQDKNGEGEAKGPDQAAPPGQDHTAQPTAAPLTRAVKKRPGWLKNWSWKAKFGSALGVLGVVGLFLGLFGYSLRDVWHWINPPDPPCGRHPADRPALSLTNPQMETAVRGVLREYAAAYGAHDEVRLGRLFSGDLCRYVDTRSPTRKEESLDEYQTQFRDQRAGGHERVRYTLVGPLKPPPGTGGRAHEPKGKPVLQVGEGEAVVYAYYRIKGQPQRKGKRVERPVLGNADIRFHLRQRHGTLLIDEIKAG